VNGDRYSKPKASKGDSLSKGVQYILDTYPVQQECMLQYEEEEKGMILIPC
jgi:hypothetical protein